MASPAYLGHMISPAQADAPPQSFARLVIRQDPTLMVNRYAIRAPEDGEEGPVIARAQQKRLALKEKVTFFADEERTEPVFGFRARSTADFNATYDVTDSGGEPIGWFRKDFRKSLARSTWHLGVASTGLEAVGTERSGRVAGLRRVWSLVLEDLPGPFRFLFDFRTPDGTLVMSSERRRSLTDVYDVELPKLPDGSRVDWRIAAAMAVALDALQAR
jgi:hypothetical protein